MKLLSVTVPCYNSEKYMRKCVDSLLIGGEDVEIMIVDDGSTDHTAEIADEYAAKYPTIVRAIHKKNGGHGSDREAHRSSHSASPYQIRLCEVADLCTNGACGRIFRNGEDSSSA